MAIEKVLQNPSKIGRKLISYLATDPAGELSLFTAYKLSDNLLVSVPFFLFSTWHIPYMFKVRGKLNKLTKKSDGLNEKILEAFNKSSWCSHRVAIAYAFGQGKYQEFKSLLNEYPHKYYLKRLGKNIRNKINEILKLGN